MAAKKIVYLIFLNVCFFIRLNGISLKNLKDNYNTDLRRLVNCLLYNNCERNLETTDRNFAFLNGIVYTVDPETDWDNPEGAIVIESGKIALVGSDEQVEQYIYASDHKFRVYDLHKTVVLPGIHDVHMHPQEAMSDIGGACKLPKNKRPDDFSVEKVLKDCPDNRIGTDWVLGAGHSITQMMDYVNEGYSPKTLLDSFITDRPAAMLEETSHSAWVNSKALEVAGITANTNERPAGVIMREPHSTEPNGILFENEAIAIFELALKSGPTRNLTDLNREALDNGLYELSEYGITSFCDARFFWRTDINDAYDNACDKNHLSARAVLGLWAYPLEDDDEQIKELKNLYSSDDTKCPLRKTQIKVYMDGIVESTTAAMKEKYLKNLSLPVISEENRGMNYFTKSRLVKYLTELQEFDGNKGFDFHIHAIGDRGIHEALDAIEDAQSSLVSRSPRHRITHLEVIDKDDIERFVKLGVIADFQVAGAFTLPSEHEKIANFIGPEKASFTIPVKSVVDTDAIATFSSDWDVSDLNPFVGIEHATKRGTQSVDVKTAIEMYTINPAYAMRQEHTVGALVQGMDADIIIIDRDILNIPEDEISEIEVLETIFMGERIYSAYDNGIEDITDSFYYYNSYY